MQIDLWLARDRPGAEPEGRDDDDGRRNGSSDPDSDPSLHVVDDGLRLVLDAGVCGRDELWKLLPRPA